MFQTQTKTKKALRPIRRAFNKKEKFDFICLFFTIPMFIFLIF